MARVIAKYRQAHFSDHIVYRATSTYRIKLNLTHHYDRWLSTSVRYERHTRVRD